jgi:long-chain acyl-CoA synthetase
MNQDRISQLIDRLVGYADLYCLDGDDGRHTFKELLDEMEAWRARLRQAQIDAGTVVGLRADYSLGSIGLLLALFSHGAIAALIPRDGDASVYLRDARAAALIDMTDSGQPHIERLKVPEQHPLLQQLRSQRQGGIVIFTSGSTGKPKAALQSLERFLHKFGKPGRRFSTLGFLMFDHVAGLDTLFYTLTSGGTLVVTRRRDPASICALIARAHVQVLPASPSFLRLLCLAGELESYDLSSLRIITYGAEPMDSQTLRHLNEIFAGIQIIQKYGTTETGSPKSVSRGNDSLWMRLKADDVETRIVDGVLWLRSEGTILGYLNGPSPVDSDGWYCTGDEVDVDGEWIRFRGRASDAISVGGEKVAPAEVEQVILALDFVHGAVVCGEKHPLLGQVVTAKISLKDEMDPQRAVKRVRTHCRERLAPYKVPVKLRVVTGPLTNQRQKAVRTNKVVR